MKTAIGRGLGGLLALALIAAGRGNPGDGRESAGDEREWSILQTAELETRSQRDSIGTFRNVDGYELMAVSRDGDARTIWIMLQPAHAPFYKQMPEGNYWISDEQVQELASQGRVTSTVESALRSHVRPR
jgi:hypothetical protein